MAAGITFNLDELIAVYVDDHIFRSCAGLEVHGPVGDARGDDEIRAVSRLVAVASVITAYVGELCIVGRRDAMLGDRMELSELLRDADESKYIIVLDHEPTDYEAEAATAADLVVSGHTHGGQLIPLTWIGERFGGNDRSYGHETRNGTDFIVTSGISDWAMHFKTGTRSEYVIIDVAETE